MSDESRIQTLSQRRRQLIKRGDLDRAGHDADLIDGRYRLLARLGGGRAGDIYEARIDGGPDAGLEQIVALQLVDRNVAASRALIDRLRRGYAALRAGPHRNIVRFEELGRDRQTWYLVMERLEGVSLRFVLDESGALPTNEALAIVRAVGDALAYLHAKSMVHGAVTPSAVFATEDYEVKLLDIFPGVEPNVAESNPALDQSDDVYGLACLAYELLTGRHPYNYAAAAEVRRLGLAPTATPQLPPVRWQALARGLDPDSDRRPSNVAVFLRDLGITGSERLSSTNSGPRETPPRAATSGGMSAVVATADDRLVIAPPAKRAGGRWIGRVLALAVVGSIGAAAWVYREPVTDFTSTRLVPAAFDLIANRWTGGGTGPERAGGATGPEWAGGQIGPEQADGEVAPVPTSGEIAPERSEAAVAGSDSGLANEADLPAESDAATPIAASGGSPAGFDTEVAVADDSDRAPTPVAESRPAFAQSVYRAREGRGPVAVRVRREGDVSTPATIVWWTSDETALAGEDYADFGQRTEEFPAGEHELTLRVPLVDDALPEPRETFLVHFGSLDPGSGSIDLIATSRVEIDDDDNSRL